MNGSKANARACALLTMPVILAACGGPVDASTSTSTSSGAEATTVATPASPTELRVRLLGAHREIAMVEVLLPREATFELPNDGCQDVLVVLREGHVGLAVTGAPSAMLEPDGAARLPMGARVPGRLEALEDSRAFVVLARTIDHAFADDDTLDEVLAAPDECTEQDGADRLRVAPAGTTGPFSQGGGALRAYVFLDMPRHGAGLASLGYLDGDETLAVPEHGHDGASEVLYFESGAGTMRIGDTTATIEPGRFVYVPAGTRHGLVPTGTAPLRALQVYTPSGPEQRFRPIR